MCQKQQGSSAQVLWVLRGGLGVGKFKKRAQSPCSRGDWGGSPGRAQSVPRGPGGEEIGVHWGCGSIRRV